jgi:hypothetical protein
MAPTRKGSTAALYSWKTASPVQSSTARPARSVSSALVIPSSAARVMSPVSVTAAARAAPVVGDLGMTWISLGISSLCLGIEGRILRTT